MANIHLKVCHIGEYEEKILSGAPNYLIGNLSCTCPVFKVSTKLGWFFHSAGGAI